MTLEAMMKIRADHGSLSDLIAAVKRQGCQFGTLWKDCNSKFEAHTTCEEGAHGDSTYKERPHTIEREDRDYLVPKPDWYYLDGSSGELEVRGCQIENLRDILRSRGMGLRGGTKSSRQDQVSTFSHMRQSLL